MAKLSAKAAVILLGGYVVSPDLSGYTVDHTVGAVDVTGFGEPQNFTPGLITSALSLEMYWNNTAGRLNTLAKVVPTATHVTIIPEGYTLGNTSLSMAAHHVEWHPQGTPESAITGGTANFYNRGTTIGVEDGYILAHGTITNTTTTTAFRDPKEANTIAAHAATLHIWDATATDTYVIKVQHSADNSAWSDLFTFSANGTALTSERQSSTGTIEQYWRVVATRTGSAGDTLGFSVHLWHGAEV